MHKADFEKAVFIAGIGTRIRLAIIRNVIVGGTMDYFLFDLGLFDTVYMSLFYGEILIVGLAFPILFRYVFYRRPVSKNTAIILSCMNVVIMYSANYLMDGRIGHSGLVHLLPILIGYFIFWKHNRKEKDSE